MSFLVVVVLSVLWLGFLVPGLLRSRRSSPYVSAATFQECLTRISTGQAVDAERVAAHPRRRLTRRQIARRRDTVTGLAGAVLAAGALGLSFGGAAVWLVVPPLLGLVTYLVVLRMDVVRGAPPVVVPRPAARDAAAQPPAPDDVVPSVRRRGTADDAALERLAG